ncbi:HNH endonuclease signature motif containing protein [Streptomyces sp. NPDC005012]|uniref:HNH endonuclease signature motif containing protein n=1 Tax=Streptomyces sp. NPDC005012 TaxID=3154558 RepID=UPI0033A3E6F3
MTTAWLMLAVGDKRQHGGNDGYDDNPRYHYSWDSTVPNHGNVAVGDVIVLWDKKELIGISVIHAIETGTDEKAVYSCALCGRADIKRRSTVTPAYRCDKCKGEFDTPHREIKTVTTYRSRHGKTWISGPDGLGSVMGGAELRALCDSPRSQLSMRPMRWEKLHAAILDIVGEDEVPVELDGGENTPIRGGHKVSKVRVRVGQSAFRERLLREQGEQCAMSGKAPAAVLEAAHLYSYAESGEHHEYGGLLLRRDIHRLFDLGQIAVDPVTSLIDVAPELHSYPLYAELHGQPVTVELRPEHLVWLEAHWLSKRTAA